MEKAEAGFLPKKLPELHKEPEVGEAVEKYLQLGGEKIPNTPDAKIGIYLNRLEAVFLHPDEKRRQRNLNLFKPILHSSFVLNRESIPESYFELQKKIARERGQPIDEIPKEIREQMIDVIIEEQKASLDNWVNYLGSNDAVYPSWFKYFVLRNILKLSQFDKKLGKFKERTDTTTAPFPDIYREALAQIADLYRAYPEKLKEIEPRLHKLRAEKSQLERKLHTASPEDKVEIEGKILQLNQEVVAVSIPIKEFSKKFPVHYAEFIQKSLANQVENKEEVKGKWIKYKKGDMGEAEELYRSLENKGTGWCTAGHSTAEFQLKSGDFYVYYTYDENGKPINPRLAIRMYGPQIAEVRGVMPHQSVEPILQDVLDTKLSEFGSEADSFKKKSADMKHLTSLEKRIVEEQEVTKEDLIFLYEIEGNIEGFGYKEDPRVSELRRKLTLEQVAHALDLDTEEVASSPAEINDKTILYLPALTIFLSNENVRSGYVQKMDNSKRISRLNNRHKSGERLSEEELRFLYFGVSGKREAYNDSLKARIIDERDVAADCRILFGPDTVLTTNMADVDEKTTVFFNNRSLYSIENAYDKERIISTARYNVLSKKMNAEQEVTKGDLIFLFEVNSNAGLLGTTDKELLFSRLKEKVLGGGHLERVFNLKKDQIAYSLDEITQETILYVPAIKEFLSEGPREPYDIDRKAVYEEHLHDEKMRRRIAQKLNAEEDLTKEEIQFVFQNHSYFEDKRGSSPKEWEVFEERQQLKEEILRAQVRHENLKRVFGEGLVKATDEIPVLLSKEGWVFEFESNEYHFPVLDSKKDGNFLLALPVRVHVLSELDILSESLEEAGYKLADRALMESFLKEGNAFSASGEMEIYGSDGLWKRFWKAGETGVEDGVVITWDDKRVKDTLLVPFYAKQDEYGGTESYQAIIAVTKVTGEGSSARPLSPEDEAYYNTIEEKGRRKTRTKKT